MKAFLKADGNSQSLFPPVMLLLQLKQPKALLGIRRPSAKETQQKADLVLFSLFVGVGVFFLRLVFLVSVLSSFRFLPEQARKRRACFPYAMTAFPSGSLGLSYIEMSNWTDRPVFWRFCSTAPLMRLYEHK